MDVKCGEHINVPWHLLHTAGDSVVSVAHALRLRQAARGATPVTLAVSHGGVQRSRLSHATAIMNWQVGWPRRVDGAAAQTWLDATLRRRRRTRRDPAIRLTNTEVHKEFAESSRTPPGALIRLPCSWLRRYTTPSFNVRKAWDVT